MAGYPSYSYEAYGAYQYTSAQYGNTSPTRTHARIPVSRGASTQKETKRVDEADLALGRIFWLPPKEDLPPRAVRRAHGKGAVEEGIYNHPVVVISRPAEEPQSIHFQIVSLASLRPVCNAVLSRSQVTSFQGKRLHEVYSKDNEFHASRRSWYLPISPSPTHPDASSKKMQKRFPTLALQHGATLRWDSYVNIRHVYKIDWALLKPYANPDTPYVQTFRFDQESCDKTLAKTKVLTNYEPGHQYQGRARGLRPMHTAKSPLPLRIPETPVRPQVQTSSPRSQSHSDYSPLVPYSPNKSVSDEGSVIGSEYSGLSPILQSDFGELHTEEEMSIPVPKKRPPDGIRENLRRLVMWVLRWPLLIFRKVRRRFGR